MKTLFLLLILSPFLSIAQQSEKDLPEGEGKDFWIKNISVSAGFSFPDGDLANSKAPYPLNAKLGYFFNVESTFSLEGNTGLLASFTLRNWENDILSHTPYVNPDITEYSIMMGLVQSFPLDKVTLDLRGKGGVSRVKGGKYYFLDGAVRSVSMSYEFGLRMRFPMRSGLNFFIESNYANVLGHDLRYDSSNPHGLGSFNFGGGILIVI